MKQLSRKRRVATWLATLLVLFLVVGLLPTGLSKEVFAGNKMTKLIIKKIIPAVGQLPESSYDFKFLVKVGQEGNWGPEETVTLNWTGNNSEKEVGTFPRGYQYYIEELPADGFTPENKILSGELQGGQTKVTFKNTYTGTAPEPVTPKLTVKKVVLGQPPADLLFRFTLERYGSGHQAIARAEHFALGDQGVKDFDANQGASYVVNEDLVAGYTTTAQLVYGDGSATNKARQLPVDEHGNVEFDYPANQECMTLIFTNTWIGTAPEPVTPKLTVKKVVLGQPPADLLFRFTLERYGSGHQAIARAEHFALGDQGVKDFDANQGASYVVNEDLVAGYTTTAQLVYGDGSATNKARQLPVDEHGNVEFDYPANQECMTLIFTNTWIGTDPEPVLPKLIVQKVVKGRETEEKFDFQVTEIKPPVDGPSIVSVNVGDNFQLGHGEYADIDAVQDKSYKVRETKKAGYTTSASVIWLDAEGVEGPPILVGFKDEGNAVSVQFRFPSEAIRVIVTFTNTWEDEGGGEDDGDTSGGDDLGEESDDTPDTDSGDETPGDETPGGEIVAGDEDEKPDEVVKGDEDEKTEEEELDVPVTGEVLSAYPFLALAMVLLAVAFLALGRRKPLEED